MRQAGHVACMGEGKVFTGFWLGGLQGRPKGRWDNNIKMDLRETESMG